MKTSPDSINVAEDIEKENGRMNKRQEVVRTTFNIYEHNSNRHLDRKDSKEKDKDIDGVEDEKRK